MQDSRLFVAVADGGHVQPKVVVDMGNPGFIGGKWQSLVISHRRSSTLLFNKDHLEVGGGTTESEFDRWCIGNTLCSQVVAATRQSKADSITSPTPPFVSSSAQVLLDEELFFCGSVPYPRHVSEPLAQCSVGWDFNGQMSGVLFLSVSAELKIIKSMLYRLIGLSDGTNEESHGFGSCPPDLDIWDDTATVSAQQRFRRKLLGSKYKIFAAFLPDRTVNGLCLEPHNGLHALLRVVSTHVWFSRTPQDVIKSIGGTPTLLALAQELLSNDPASQSGSQLSSPFSDRNVDTVLSILLSFLDGNVANQVRDASGHIEIIACSLLCLLVNELELGLLVNVAWE